MGWGGWWLSLYEKNEKYRNTLLIHMILIFCFIKNYHPTSVLLSFLGPHVNLKGFLE